MDESEIEDLWEDLKAAGSLEFSVWDDARDDEQDDDDEEG